MKVINRQYSLCKSFIGNECKCITVEFFCLKGWKQNRRYTIIHGKAVDTLNGTVADADDTALIKNTKRKNRVFVVAEDISLV